jgi:nucleoside-specific outer membrane channel protein Tsx
MTRARLATASALFALVLPVSSQAQESGFFLWADTSVSVLPYGSGFEVDPRDQSTLTFEHAHESKLGDIFAFVDFTKFHDVPSGADDSTWYGEIGPRFSFGKMLGKDLSHTFFRKSLFEIKDVLLALQYERGEDPDVAEAALIGVGFDLDVREAGLLGGLGKFNYVQLNFYGRAEMTEGTKSGIRDMQVTMVASYPFKTGRVDWLLDGYFDWVLGLGSEDWNYHLNPQLTADLGGLLWNAPKKLYAGVEIDLWWNKYQIPNSAAFDTNQQALSLLFKYHF